MSNPHPWDSWTLWRELYCDILNLSAETICESVERIYKRAKDDTSNSYWLMLILHDINNNLSMQQRVDLAVLTGRMPKVVEGLLKFPSITIEQTYDLLEGTI